MPIVNPFGVLAEGATKVVADGWTALMLTFWNAGLWVLRLILTFLDAFTTPDVSEAGPAAEVYRFTFWTAGALCVLLMLVQLGVAAARRDGGALARVAIGFGQFAIVWAGWIAYASALIAACGGLTVGAMKVLLGVDAWAAWQPWQPLTLSDVSSEPVVATVLGMLGLLLWVAAIAHVLVMLTRAAALLVLACTAPIAAAGAVSELGRPWLWKSVRWFHATALTPLLMVLVLGLGVQVTSGVATGLGTDLQREVGTAVPGVVLILVSAFAPLALFRLLAFVDPSTGTGAAMRRGLDAQGGFKGLLGGGAPSTGAATSGAASSTDDLGRSSAETAGDDATVGRFAQAKQALGPIGQAAGTGLSLMQGVARTGVAVGTDLTNQMGAGHHGYHPDIDSRSDPGGDQGSDHDSSSHHRAQQGSGDGSGFGSEGDAAGGGAGAPGPQATSWTDLGGSPDAGGSGKPASGAPGKGAARPTAGPGGPAAGGGAAGAGAGAGAADAAVVAVL